MAPRVLDHHEVGDARRPPPVCGVWEGCRGLDRGASRRRRVVCRCRSCGGEKTVELRAAVEVCVIVFVAHLERLAAVCTGGLHNGLVRPRLRWINADMQAGGGRGGDHSFPRTKIIHHAPVTSKAPTNFTMTRRASPTVAWSQKVIACGRESDARRRSRAGSRGACCGRCGGRSEVLGGLLPAGKEGRRTEGRTGRISDSEPARCPCRSSIRSPIPDRP